MVDSRQPGESPAAGRPGQPADPPPLPHLSHRARSRSRMPEVRSAESACERSLRFRTPANQRRSAASRKPPDERDRTVAVSTPIGSRPACAQLSLRICSRRHGRSLHRLLCLAGPNDRSRFRRFRNALHAAQQTRTRQHRRRRPQAPPQPKVPTTRRSSVAAPRRGAGRTLPSAAAPSRLARLLATPPRARAVRYSIAVRDPSAICTTRSARRGTRPPPVFPHRSRCRARRRRWPHEAIGSSCEIPCASQRTADPGRIVRDRAAWHGTARRDIPCRHGLLLFPGCQLHGEQCPATVQSRSNGAHRATNRGGGIRVAHLLKSHSTTASR